MIANLFYAFQEEEKKKQQKKQLKLKKLTTPALLQKIAAGVAMLVFSSANALLVLLQGFKAETHIFALALALACLVCAVLLGMMGKKLIPVILLGK